MSGETDPIPSWDERERLKALDAYEILDTPKEEDFEDIVQMAARVCKAPISVINFISSDRQWFKAELGLGVRETPLGISICAHAILQPGVFTVPDATKDDRFRHNPLVTGDPNLRFYAGALLETPEGLPLGTMCILDYKPRVLTEDESLTLQALARQVMTQLELRRALKAKSKSEERLSLALNSSGFIGIWEWDIVKDRVYADAQFVTAFGGEPFWSVEGAPVAEYLKSIHPDDLPMVNAGVERALKLGGIFREEYRLLQKDGSVRWIEARGKCHFDREGNPTRFPGVAVDVTERHQAQLRTEFLGQLTQKLSTVSNPEEITLTATGEIGRFLGADRCYFFQVLPDEQSVRVLPDWHGIESHSLEGHYELSNFGLDERWQALRRGPVAIEDIRCHPWTRDFAENYQPTGIVGCVMSPFVHEGKWVGCLGVSSLQPRQWTRDEAELLENAMARVWPLIERARTDLALRESEQRFRAMSDNIAPLAWMAHADGALFWYNKRWYDYTGESLETMRGDGWKAVHDPAHLGHVVETWTRAVAEGKPWEDTFPLRGVDGNFRWFLSRAFPIRDDEGKVKLWFGVNTDVTELRQINAQLGDRATHLEALVQQRTQKLSETISELEAFSYSISHDMRSPLRSMIGFAEILKEEFAPKLGAEGIDYLNRISNASRRMDQLIQDVLVFSRLSREDVVLEAVDADSLIRGILQSYPNLHPDVVEITLRSPLPTVRGNAALLTQCFSNLLENGAKFVAPGTKPKLEVWSETSPGRVKIFFQDQGIGISEHNLKRIFEIFHRVGRGNDGTGIGLAIVRKAAEKMGGSVGVQSELGKGSLFWLDLQSA